jgi:hypothetical protein
MPGEDTPPHSTVGRRQREEPQCALQLGPRKKLSVIPASFIMFRSLTNRRVYRMSSVPDQHSPPQWDFATGVKTEPVTPESPTPRILTHHPLHREPAMLFDEPRSFNILPALQVQPATGLVDREACDGKNGGAVMRNSTRESDTVFALNGYFLLTLAVGSGLAVEVARTDLQDTHTAHGEGTFHFVQDSISYLTSAGLDTSLVTTFKPSYRYTLSLVMRLDSYTNPGLTEEEFLGLIAKCLGCGRYMTRRTIDQHECQENPVGSG